MKKGIFSDDKTRQLRNLRQIPGVGKSIAVDLWNIGIRKPEDLKEQEPEVLFDRSNTRAGVIQDRCLLYVFRCAVYYANTPAGQHNKELLKWWNWKD